MTLTLKSMSKRPRKVALEEDVDISEKRSREDPDQDGEGGERTPGSTLTANNVVKVLQHVRVTGLWEEWEYVSEKILEISEGQLDELTINCTTDEKRLQLAVTFWLLKCSYASWRHLIWSLEWEYQHDVASQIHGFAESLTDPSLNVETLMSLLSSLNVLSLEEYLLVPTIKKKMIKQQSKTEEERRRGLIQWYLNYSPFADLVDLAGELYRFEKTNALQEVKRHIQRVPESTLSLSNITEVFCQVNDPCQWSGNGLPWLLNIPYSKTEEIEEQYRDIAGRKEALLKYYLDCTPFPSWKRVAYAAYTEREYGALETILQRYLKVLNLQKMCEEAVLKCVRTEEDIDSLPLPKRIRCSMKTNTSSHYIRLLHGTRRLV